MLIQLSTLHTASTISGIYYRAVIYAPTNAAVAAADDDDDDVDISSIDGFQNITRRTSD